MYSSKDLTAGDMVVITECPDVTKEELQTLKNLNFTLTVEDLDVIDDKVYGIYTEELPGYLFTFSEFEKLP